MKEEIKEKQRILICDNISLASLNEYLKKNPVKNCMILVNEYESKTNSKL